ncbi:MULTISPECIES: SixA phosphatase family protein [unclassified Agarivorans]|uniref:SixA phosphatase family protein n=1 Tax=unclassified Agarivorans TaxID=2636026 RepID=UPI003D7D02A2
MARHLWLIRHAKSSWQQPWINDRERPLSARGRAAAALMACDYALPFARLELLQCSPAIRAQQSCEYWLTQRQLHCDRYIEIDLHVTIEASLYTSRWADLLLHIQAFADRYHHVALIGHNPALEQLLEYLTAQQLPKFPTASLAILECNVSAWSELTEGSANLVLFDTPKRRLAAKP